MTREEAKTVFLNRGYVEVEGGTIYDSNKWRESCRVISEWLEQEPCEDCNHYGKFSLDCGRCDDCSMFEPQEESEKWVNLAEELIPIMNEEEGEDNV